MRKCPNDHVNLKAARTTAGVEIDYCPKCFGLWLDQDEIFAFSTTPNNIRAELKKAYELRKPSLKRSPVTGEPMVELDLFQHSVVVDYCQQSGGLWLDQKEITHFPVELKLERKGRPKAAKGAKRPQTANPTLPPKPPTPPKKESSLDDEPDGFSGSFASLFLIGVVMMIVVSLLVFAMAGTFLIGFLIWVALAIFIFVNGIRIVRPTQRGIVERFGKYARLAAPGFHWIIPLVDQMYRINITEMMVDAEPQEIITNDNLNASVDAQIYFRINSDEENIKRSQYSVNSIEWQIVNLARTTLRSIIGTLSLKEANSERGMINDKLFAVLSQETAGWGVEIVRTELKQIDPPPDVQATMNKVVKAENEKVAAVDFATATETKADGLKRSEIKKAEGVKQARILAAEGESEAIRLVNEAAEKYFVGNAQTLRKLETVEHALQTDTKVVLPAHKELMQVIGTLAGIKPEK